MCSQIKPLLLCALLILPSAGCYHFATASDAANVPEKKSSTLELYLTAVDAHEIVFRGITLTGFWLVKFLTAMSGDEKTALYGELAERVASGELTADVEAVYPMEEIREALEHAARAGRDGKVLVTPNGPVSR